MEYILPGKFISRSSFALARYEFSWQYIFHITSTTHMLLYNGICICVCGMSIKPLYHTLVFDLNLAIYLAYKCEERDHAGKLITFFV